MEFNEYQELANQSLAGNEQVLTQCALGLASETGEVLARIQKYTFNHGELNRDDLIKEMAMSFGIYLKLLSGLTFLFKKLLIRILKCYKNVIQNVLPNKID